MQLPLGLPMERTPLVEDVVHSQALQQRKVVDFSKQHVYHQLFVSHLPGPVFHQILQVFSKLRIAQSTFFAEIIQFLSFARHEYVISALLSE